MDRIVAACCFTSGYRIPDDNDYKVMDAPATPLTPMKSPSTPKTVVRKPPHRRPSISVKSIPFLLASQVAAPAPPQVPLDRPQQKRTIKKIPKELHMPLEKWGNNLFPVGTVHGFTQEEMIRDKERVDRDRENVRRLKQVCGNKKDS